MTTKYKIIIVAITIVLVFASGRYSAKQVSAVNTETHKVSDTTTDKQKDTHTITTTTTKKDASGIETTMTVTDTTTETHVDKKQNAVTDQQKQITYNNPPRTTVQGLAGIDFHTDKPVFGGAISRQIVGPISVGVWGLSNGSGGVSVGVSF